MIPFILTAILLVSLIISVFTVVKKRRNAGITGLKTALTPICLYVMAVLNIFAYWFNFMGVITWTIGFALILLSAYFTKYIPNESASA